MAEDFLRDLGYLALGSRLKRLGERLQADVQRISADAGLTIPAGLFPLLASLDREGVLTVGSLAGSLGLSQPWITRSVVRLERLGLVRTRRGERDPREKRIELSESGIQLIARAKRELWPKVRAAVEDLCKPLEGSLIQQLDGFEDALANVPLDRRIASVGA